MKKFGLLLTIFLSFFNLNAHNVNITAKQGYLYLQDSSYSYFDEDWGLSSELYAKDGDVVLRLVRVHIPEALDIEQGSKILIKLDNGETIIGEAFIDSEYMPREYGYLISQFVTPLYVFREDDMDKIMKNGITKIRIEIGTIFIDKDIPLASRDYVKESLRVLEKAVHSRPSIYDNF